MREGTLVGKGSPLSTIIVLHTCYIILSIALSLLLLDNTTLRLGVSRSMMTFLDLLATKRPFTLRHASLGNQYRT